MNRDAKETLENFWESCQRQIKAAGEVEELVRELCADARDDYGKGRHDGIWEMKELVEKVAVMTADERKEAFGIISMESLFPSRTYEQIKETYDAWKERPTERDCHNCACSVWYSREDGDVTWLCIREQPEKSVRVTLPNICCEYWRAGGEN